MEKVNNKNYRLAVQVFFLFLVLLIGYEFYGFVRYLESGGSAVWFERPPGVEAFLPISSLISLKYYFLSGEINFIHPAGIFIFVSIILVSLIIKKSFCSWICPFSLLSEYLWKTGSKIFGRNLKMPIWLDSVLRGLKYLLLLFFLWAVLFKMDAGSLQAFIYSPYNKVADIKMFLFFRDFSSLTIYVLAGLIVLSVIFKNFWCRYLCPYGALLGIISFLSPFKINRIAETCTNCQKCTKVCPELISVHKKKQVLSDQCMSCMVCVDKCPEKDTLTLKSNLFGKKLAGLKLAAAVLLFYFIFTGYAILTGNWRNSISESEYISRMKEIHSPLYEHTRGKVQVEKNEYDKSTGR